MKSLSESSKRTRGRPPTGGTQPGWMLFRTLIALESYDRARQAGLLYVKAIKKAISAVQEACPGMRMSATEVKRVTAMYRPKCTQHHLTGNTFSGCVVTKGESHTWNFGEGVIPKYPYRVHKPKHFTFSAKYRR